MDVHGSGSSKTPQVTERLVGIEETQRQLGDALKALDTEVKDSMAALKTEMNELAATVKVLILAMGKTPTAGVASKSKGKEKVPEPRSDTERGAGKVEQVIVASSTEDVAIVARRKLEGLRQKGSLRDYVKEFTATVQDIREMSEKEKLNVFLDGLSQEVSTELQWCGVRSFSEAVSTVKHLAEYDISVRSHKSREPKSRDTSVGRSGRIGKSTSGGAEKRKSVHLRISSPSPVPTKKSKILKCFLCDGPHKLKDCPQKAAMTALRAQVQEEPAGSKRPKVAQEKAGASRPPKALK